MVLPPPNDQPPLTREEIRDQVMARVDVSRQGANVVINLIINEMARRLSAGESLSFRGFGIFRSHVRPERPGRGMLAGKRQSRKRVLRFVPATKVRHALRSRARVYFAERRKSL